jgi:hypothetical protein
MVHYDEQVDLLTQEIADGEKALAGTREQIARVKLRPINMQTELQQLTRYLQNAQTNLEIANQTALDGFGTEYEGAALEDQRRAEARIAQLKKDIPAMEKRHAEQTENDALELTRLTKEEETLARALDEKRHRVNDLHQEKHEKHNAEGEKRYRSLAARYQVLKANELKKRQSALDAKLALDTLIHTAHEQLEPYPEWLRKIQQEHGVVKEDGVTSIVRAAVALLTCLITYSENLESAPALRGGQSLIEVLALTDQDLLAHQWDDGGTYSLKQRRALLLSFLESNSSQDSPV